MNKLMAIGIGAVLLLLLLIFSTTYTVSFHEVAILRTFGSGPGSVRTEPGLKWKWPIIQAPARYDTRLQIKETALEELSTADGQQIVVRAYLLWQVDTDSEEGPLAFHKAYESLEEAGSSLGDPLVTALGGAIGQYRFEELIGPQNKLDEAEQRIAANLADVRSKGIRTVSVGISQMLLPERTTNSVARRMEATRSTLAEAKRYEGNARAEQIQARAATLADKIRAFAELRAADIRSQAAEKTGEYLAQMSEEEELAIFLVWLDTLEASLNGSSTFMLGTDFAPWHLMDTAQSAGAGSVPQPARGGAEPAGSPPQVVATPPAPGNAAADDAGTAPAEAAAGADTADVEPR